MKGNQSRYLFGDRCHVLKHEGSFIFCLCAIKEFVYLRPCLEWEDLHVFKLTGPDVDCARNFQELLLGCEGIQSLHSWFMKAFGSGRPGWSVAADVTVLFADREHGRGSWLCVRLEK